LHFLVLRVAKPVPNHFKNFFLKNLMGNFAQTKKLDNKLSNLVDILYTFVLQYFLMYPNIGINKIIFMVNFYTKSLVLLFFGFFLNDISAQNPSFNISPNYGNIVEGTASTLTFTLSAANNANTVINIATSDGTATVSDYAATTSTITIPAGQTTYTVTIASTNDAIPESSEYFTLNATVTSGNTSNVSYAATITISDNDTIPTLTFYNASITEGSSQTKYANLSNPYHSNIVINFVSTIGTAGTADFTSISTSKTILAGNTSTSLLIATANDALIESNETFTINVTSATISNSPVSTTITIVDNDTLPTATFGLNTSIIEGNFLNLSVSLSNPYNAAITIALVSTNGTAGATDYTPISTNLVINAGSRFASINFATTNDTLDEPSENFTITATSASLSNSPVSQLFTIIDDDGLPEVTIGNVSALEGENAQFSIEINPISLVDTTIQMVTGTGTAGTSDFTATSMLVTIPARTSYASFSVPIILDTIQEETESFTVSGIVTSGNSFNTTFTGTGTILDNYNLNANYDNIEVAAGLGTTFQVLTNDTFHGLAVNSNNVTITLTSNNYGITLNSSGVLTVPQTIAIGYYNLTYTICETANPNNCDTSEIFVQITTPLLFTGTGIYFDSNADGFTNVGDVINYQLTYTNVGNSPISNVVSNIGITVTGTPVTWIDPGISITVNAIHVITQQDINNGGFGFFANFTGTYNSEEISSYCYGTNQDYCIYNQLSTSNGIKLNAFLDTNANGIQDTGEENFRLGNFNYVTNNNGVVHDIYSWTNYYLYESNPATTYNLTYTVLSQYAPYYISTAAFPNVTVAAGSGITTYNFPITAIPYNDVSVYLYRYLPPRPGFSYYNYVTYRNNGSQSIASGTLTFTKPSEVTISAIEQTGTVANTTGFSYTFTNLLPNEYRSFWVKMEVPTIPTVILGQQLTSSAQVAISGTDAFPSNNFATKIETIVGSYDPNKKSEAHGGKILYSAFTANDYLTYTINFENTGTANAINVKVTDVLNVKLDATSVKMIDASAAFSLERVGTTLTWKFNGINLPPSSPSSETIGHGFITFQVKPKPGYAIGDNIPNTANIYFDFNPAIITNTNTTLFVQTLEVDEFETKDFIFSPNPATDSVLIELKNENNHIKQVKIIDHLGRIIQTNSFSSSLNSELINLNTLTSGTYFLEVTSDSNQRIIKKLIKN
jgi:uncharacterized repeat protein (TIGR01451 family)